MKKIAIVVQRSHESVVGGSETLAWQYAMLLKNDYHVDVLTTTAVDAVTWENTLPAGTEKRDGVSIQRFKVDCGRTVYWHALHERLLKEFEYENRVEAPSENQKKKIHWTLALQEEFIRKQGPYSADLTVFLSEQFHNYKAVIFFTYLFPTTYFSIPRCSKEHCLLVPTLHDEPPAYLSAYKYMAGNVRTLLWNTETERRLGTFLWGELPGRVMGAGVNIQEYPPANIGYPYLLYCGRIDPYKGCDHLVEYFMKYKKDNPSNLRLVFTGKDEIGLTAGAGIDLKGFVSDEEKFRFMAGALLFVMPSPYESLSIVTLEAMAQRTPVLVNGKSEVLVEHVEKSGGGFVYHNYHDFAAAISNVFRNQSQSAIIGKMARDYVVSHYSFQRVRDILKEEIEKHNKL